MSVKDQCQIYHSGRVKYYDVTGTLEIMAASRPMFCEPGWEPVDEVCKPHPQARTPTPEAEKIARSMRRARSRLRDLCMSNQWDFFVTLTLDKRRIDRYDMLQIVKALRVWLDNQVRRHGLRYVLVPERHRDGAIHFHGFFAGGNLRPVDSGHVDRCGHVIYNLDAWPLGFTTAIVPYGDYATAVSYVVKYIGKQGDKPAGRWFYSGGALEQPRVVYAEIAPEDLPDGSYTVRVEEAFATIGIWRGVQDG